MRITLNLSKLLQEGKIDEAECARLIALAKRETLHVRAYVAAAWVCPFEGLTPHQQSVEMTTKLLEWGADEVALADTVGHATPPQVRSLIERVIGLGVKTEQLAVHLCRALPREADRNIDTHKCRRSWDVSVPGLASRDHLYTHFLCGHKTSWCWPKPSTQQSKLAAMIR